MRILKFEEFWANEGLQIKVGQFYADKIQGWGWRPGSHADRSRWARIDQVAGNGNVMSTNSKLLML